MSRKPTFKSQPSMAPNAMHEDFKPVVAWSEDPSNHTLMILLPGFKSGEVRVQLDNAGKLLIKGSRKASDNKYLGVNQSFDVPKDTIAEKISGRFEDGCLTLIMPKKAVKEEEEIQKATSKEKVKEAIPEEKPKGDEGKKEEEAIQKEEKTSEERKDEPIREKPTSHEEKVEPMHKEKPQATEEKQGELTQKEKPKTEGEKKDDGPILREKMQSVEDKKEDDPIHQQKMERGGEKKDEPVEKEKAESVEKEKEDSIQTENTVPGAMERAKEENTIQTMKSKIREICTEKPKETRKKISSWRGSEESRSNSGSLDGILEKLNRNMMVIAVAVVAFSAGFYVSHKLRA